MCQSGARWVGAALLCAALPAAASSELTVISFGRADHAALVAAYVEPFARTTGIDVHSLSYDGQVTELTQMVQAGAPVWDVMQVESRTLEQGCRLGLFEKLDPARVPAAKDLIPGALSECGVGIFTWAQALVYSDQLRNAPQSWADFWDVRKYPGKRGLRHSAKYTLEIALLADGVDPKDVYPTLATEAGVKRAFRKLDQIRKDTIWWEAAAQPGALIAAGRVNMSSAYTLWFDPGQERNRHTRIVWRQSLYDIDSWAIPRGSPKRDEAYRFIAFASSPERQKVLSEHLTYGPTNRNALLGATADRETLTEASPSWIRGAESHRRRPQQCDAFCVEVHAHEQSPGGICGPQACPQNGCLEPAQRASFAEAGTVAS